MDFPRIQQQERLFPEVHQFDDSITFDSYSNRFQIHLRLGYNAEILQICQNKVTQSKIVQLVMKPTL